MEQFTKQKVLMIRWKSRYCRYFALKKIRMESEEENIPSTAIRKISILKELTHSNVIELCGVIYINRKLILVFEFIDFDPKRFMGGFSKEKRLGPLIVKSSPIRYYLLPLSKNPSSRPKTSRFTYLKENVLKLATMDLLLDLKNTLVSLISDQRMYFC